MKRVFLDVATSVLFVVLFGWASAAEAVVIVDRDVEFTDGSWSATAFHDATGAGGGPFNGNPFFTQSGITVQAGLTAAHANGSAVTNADVSGGGATLQQGTYSVSFSVGNYNNQPFGFVDTTTNFAGLTHADAVVRQTSTPSTGDWSLWNYRWNVAADNPNIGNPLSFSLSAGGASNAAIDGVGGQSNLGDGFIVDFSATPPPTRENSSHQMASGNLTGSALSEVAYIQSTSGPGAIFIHDFESGLSKTVAGVTATQVIVANIDGVGFDELVFIDGNTNFLSSYNTTTDTVTVHSNFAIQDVTAGQIDGDAEIELLTARADNTLMQFFDNSTGLFTTPPAGGAAGNNVRANFNNNGLDDFAVRNGPNNGSGGLFTLADPYGGFGSLGGGLDRIATGNLDGNSDPADEVYLTNSGGSIFTHGINGPNSFYRATTGAGTDPTIGHTANNINGDDRDLAYIIGTNGQIFQGTTAWNLGVGASMTYTLLRVDGTLNGSAAAAGNTPDFFDLFAADIDGDGIDELFGRKLVDGGVGLFMFSNGTSSIILAQPTFVPEPGTATLIGMAGMALLRRRRTA